MSSWAEAQGLQTVLAQRHPLPLPAAPQETAATEGVISYTLRHTYITDALARGVSAALVAELAGHKDLKMIQQHYAHLSEKRQHLAEAARKAAGYGETPPEQKRPA